MKKLLVMALMLLSMSVQANDGVLGFWQTIDDETNKPKSIVAVYEYQGVIYARILKTYEADGVSERDNITLQKHKADKVKGEPFFCGLDFVWGMKKNKPTDEKYKGKILNPPAGKIYNSEMWLEDGNLIVRGKIGPFGKSQTWKRAPAFEGVDVSKFVPVAVEVK